MQGIERKYCDVCISAVVGAWRELMDITAYEALRKTRYGKGDALGQTMGLDAIPELTISGRIKDFDEHAIFITEELDEQARRRWPTDSDPIRQPLMIFCDPTDRSIELEKYIQEISVGNPMGKVGVLMAACDQKAVWEKVSQESPAIITGSSTAITCVRKGEVIFSIILNYITGTIFIATNIGVYHLQLNDYADPANEALTFSDITKKGQHLVFPSVRDRGFSLDDCRRFSTFMGKKGYPENFTDSELFVEDWKAFIHHSTPPGPPRPLYLSELQRNYGPVGFVMANGEKIGEWIHWLAFVKFARNENGGQALRAFEIYLERPWTKYGILMSTSPAYSLFYGEPGNMFLDISRLRTYERPSQFRCMLVVLLADNERITNALLQHQYREVTTSF